MPVAVSRASEAGPSRRHRIESSPEESDEDEEEVVEEGWTIETFENQPVTKNSRAIHMIRTLVDKMKDVITRVEEGMEQAKETAIALEDASQDEPSIQRVEAALFRAYDQRQILQIRIELLEQRMTRLRANDELTGLEDDYEKEARAREKEYISKSNWAKYRNLKEYSDFRSALWEINHQTACPPVSTFLDKGPDDEEDDDDIDIGGATQNYRCPLTLVLFQDAMTSTKCGHNYSKDAIMGLIDGSKRAKRAAKCPVTGCSKVLEKSDLKPNPTLQKRADEFERRRLRREDEREEDGGNDTLLIEDDEE